MESRKAVLQKIADDRYIVRLGIQRIGEVIHKEEKWHYIVRSIENKEGYDTREQATSELIQATHPKTKRLKKPADYSRLDFRLK